VDEDQRRDEARREAQARVQTCLFTANEERDFVRDYLGPTLHRNGLADVKLMIWDHNRGGPGATVDGPGPPSSETRYFGFPPDVTCGNPQSEALSSSCAWAAASRAIGTRYGEHDT